MKPAEQTSVADVRADARDFILARGLAGAFDRVQQLAIEHFPTLRALRVVLEADPEVAGCEQVCLEAVVAGTVEQVLDWEDAFTAAFCRLVGPDKRGLFVLTTIVAEE